MVWKLLFALVGADNANGDSGNEPPSGNSREAKKKQKKKKKKGAVDSKYIGKKMEPESKERRAARASRQQGAFVYQGSGKKHSKSATLSERKCEKQTLAVQWCLAKHDHKQKNCQGLVEVWKDCQSYWDSRDPRLKRSKANG